MEKKYTICIGRQYGSGGREIGELVARKLGVTCYDKLLIQEAAKKSGAWIPSSWPPMRRP